MSACYCDCDKDAHDPELSFCRTKGCFCMKFDPRPMTADEVEHMEAQNRELLASLESVDDKVAWLLDNFPNLRNVSEHEFGFEYWRLVQNFKPGTVYTLDWKKSLTCQEVTIRSRKRLAAKEPDKYGKFDPKAIQRANQIFELKTEYYRP